MHAVFLHVTGASIAKLSSSFLTSLIATLFELKVRHW